MPDTRALTAEYEAWLAWRIPLDRNQLDPTHRRSQRPLWSAILFRERVDALV